MATITKLPSGSYRVQIRRKGLGYLSETFKTRQEAEDWASTNEHGLMAKHHAAAPALVTSGVGLTFAELVDKYFSSTVYSNKANSTQRRERGSSQRLLQEFGHLAAAVVDSVMVQEYLDKRSKELKRLARGRKTTKTVSGHTVRLEKAFLSQIFKFGKHRRLVPQNVMLDTFDLPTCHSREGRITLHQQMRLFENAQELMANPRTNRSLLPWLCFMFETGSRPGEAAKTEISWFDLDQRKVSIPRYGQKQRNPRLVLLSDNLVEILRVQMEMARSAGSPFMFFSRAKEPRQRDENGRVLRRKRINPASFAREPRPYVYYSSWRALCARSGIPSTINPHIIRHEYISRLFESTDLNDGQIASLVGDLNVLSLQPYRHLRVERLRHRQDAHLDQLRETLNQLEAQRRARFGAHVARVLQEAQRDREAVADRSTPLERIRAALKAAELLERLQDSDRLDEVE